MVAGKNADPKTIDSFGDEWQRFDQAGMPEAEARAIFERYFAIFPWERLPEDASGFDMGCGSGRWARFVAPRVATLHCIDPSAALDVAEKNLAGCRNVVFHEAGVDDDCLPEGSQDFGYSLGVLHHIPDTQAALGRCARMLKPGAPFLLYLYYAFDNRGRAFRMLWSFSNVGRKVVSVLPAPVKRVVTDAIALAVYWPVARSSLLLEKLGMKVASLPLSFYRNRSFYTMRTDARDRFGTPLEQRFTRSEIETMMRNAGLDAIRFSSSEPYWCAVGIKR
ncbi:MAG TPA: class I SAM-dependent methyltransferase [Xanthomonadaceae bacterium]|jgi:SAM-dependent methyltransferase